MFILATDLNKSTKDYHITFAKAFVNGIIDRSLRCAVEGQKKELISLVKIEMKHHLDSNLLKQLNDIDDEISYTDYTDFIGNLLVIAFSNKDDNEEEKVRHVLDKLKEIIEPTTFSDLIDSLNKDEDNKDYESIFSNYFLRHLLRKKQ
jgi:predicted DNA-binding ArsR family transcriptional regulator